MYNRIAYKRYLMSSAADAVIRRYVDSVRNRVRFRKILLRNLLSYIRTVEHVSITEAQVQLPVRLYIHKSELVIYEKIATYIKRYLFRQKLYDLCDDFDQHFTIDRRSANSLLILR